MSYTPIKFSETSDIGVNSDTAISGGNWATNTYTGTWESNEYAYAGINLQVDEPGTLYFDFTQDADASPVASSSYPVAGFTIASGINEVHTAWKGSREFRVRFVGTGGRTFFRLKTFYSNHPLPLSAPLNQGIGSDQDATVVRSVGIGEDPTGTYTNIKSDGAGYRTTALLADAATYDSGVLDLQGYTQVQTHITASHNGTIDIDFCVDSAGTDVARSLSIPYIAANGFQLFSAPAFTPYVRYQFTNNGGETQTDFFYETKFLTKSLSGQLLGMEAFIAPSMVANLGRSVIVGQDSTGLFRNVPTDTEGHLEVNVVEPNTAFGDLRVAELTPQVHLTFPYTINGDLLDKDELNGGTVTQSNSMAVLQTSTASNGLAHLCSRDVVNYRSGLGTLARFTALFSTGVANSQQTIGIGDNDDGFFVGYDGTAFGFLVRRGGIDTWTPQTSFNVDTLDGNGPSDLTIDQTKINVFQIKFQWLGAGQIELGIENPVNGRFIPAHRIKYANSDTQPSIYNPSLTLCTEIKNTGNTTNLTLKTASMAGFTEGKNVVTGPVNTHTGSNTGVTTEVHSFHLENKTTYGDASPPGNNKVRARIIELVAGTDNATKLGKVSLYLNATLAGVPAWTDINSNDSVIRYDTTQTYTSGGKLLFTAVLGPASGNIFDLDKLNIKLIPGDVLTVTVQCGGSSDMETAVTWQEDF